MNRSVSLMAALACCGVVLSISGCGGGYGSTQPSYTPPPVVNVSISPNFQAMDQGQSVTFTATTDDASGKGVTWSMSGPGMLAGQTSSSTTYQAPSPVSSPTQVTVTATSVTNMADVFSVGFNVVPPPVIVTSPVMQGGNVGTPYGRQIPTTGGTGNFTFALTGGTMPPPGLTLSAGGFISGTPAFPAQNYNFKVILTDASPGGNVTTPPANLSINIGAPLPLVITPSTPPAGTVGFPYSPPAGFIISATGGVPPFNFTLAAGSNPLPAGLNLTTNTGTPLNQGVISGTPTAAGTTNNIIVQVTDSQPVPVTSPTVTYSITINPSTSFIGTQAPGDIWQIFVVHNPVATAGMFQENDQGAGGLPGTTGFTRTHSFGTTPAGFRQYLAHFVCSFFRFRCTPVFGYAVEMQDEMALLQPDAVGSKVVAAVANNCPQLSAPTSYQFVTLPSRIFSITDAAYGNVAVTQTNNSPNTYSLTSNTFLLDGTPSTVSSMQTGVLCDTTFQVLTIPGASPTTMAFSGHGAMVIDNGTGIPSVGLQQPASPLSTSTILAGKYLGVFFRPNSAPGTFQNPARITQMVGFGPNTGPTLTGGIFVSPGGDLFSAHPTDHVITLGTQALASPGLFPGGTLAIGTNPVINHFDVVAGQVNGKFVLYGVGLDTSNSSSPQPTAVLLIQQ